MTNNEIGVMLREYQQAKILVKKRRVELMRVAVDMFGMSQSDAQSLDVAMFLDGYLVGQGMKQDWRDIPAID
jgi:hypothetical protein